MRPNRWEQEAAHGAAVRETCLSRPHRTGSHGRWRAPVVSVRGEPGTQTEHAPWHTASCGGIEWRMNENSRFPQVKPGNRLIVSGCPLQDSNLRTRLRRPLLYPLS